MRASAVCILQKRKYDVQHFLQNIEPKLPHAANLVEPLIKDDFKALTDCGIPIFQVPVKNINFIYEPTHFYDKLLELITKSETRISIASLYLGTGDLETRLIDALNQELKNKPKLKAQVIFDYTRATRKDSKGRSSVSLVDSIQSERFNFRLFLSPAFNYWFYQKYLLPIPKLNEVLALQHMKCYAFDDYVIISGANLNAQYFTNRQDRYVIIQDAQFAQYIHELVEQVSQHSSHANKEAIPVNEKVLRNAIISLNNKYSNKSIPKKSEDYAQLIPLLQLAHAQITSDAQFTENFFKRLPENCELMLASGYFNLTEQYKKLLCSPLIAEQKSKVSVLFASEKVNSFYKAPGLLGLIPGVYTDSAKRFLKTALLNQNVTMQMWSRPNWTFHAKGVWLKWKDSMCTLIGSSNFGYRSINRDLELQVVIRTSNKDLIKQMQEEQKHLYAYGLPINRKSQLPKTSLKVKAISKLIRKFF